MPQRFVTIWFRYLKTDWLTIRQPALSHIPFVLATPDHGRMVITTINQMAKSEGIEVGMALADARVIIPSLKYFDDRPELSAKLLNIIAKWCIRFTPIASIDEPDGIILDASGCAHLWGNENFYLEEIGKRLKKFGYDIKIAMADTIGCAWAISRFGNQLSIINSGDQLNALLALPPEALRIEPETSERLHKLGLVQIRNFISMPRSTLQRRFGDVFIKRLDQALGNKEEKVEPVIPIEPYQERLPCLEPIVTATGIEIALQQLLEKICRRLVQEQKGIRVARFKAYCIDGRIEKIEIGTNRASCHINHLFKLFEIKIDTIEPGLGIELFILEALKVDDIFTMQEKLWDVSCGLQNTKISELVDRLTNKIGDNSIHRYLPDEHHWPERSVRLASSLNEQTSTQWRSDKRRPVQLLLKPEAIDVTAPIPDYPPMLFRYKNKLHKIKKADGPERIEKEWWIEEGLHRDYYCVEDEEGNRYWLFRSGHYTGDKNDGWFIHGFFA